MKRGFVFNQMLVAVSLCVIVFTICVIIRHSCKIKNQVEDKEYEDAGCNCVDCLDGDEFFYYDRYLFGLWVVLPNAEK